MPCTQGTLWIRTQDPEIDKETLLQFADARELKISNESVETINIANISLLSYDFELEIDCKFGKLDDILSSYEVCFYNEIQQINPRIGLIFN